MTPETQEWVFQPMRHPLVGTLIFAFIAAFILIGGILTAWLGRLMDGTMYIFSGAALSAWLFFSPNLPYRKWRQYRRWHTGQPEFLRLDGTGIHFHIFPCTGSLKYSEIRRVAYFYQDRLNINRYLADTGKYRAYNAPVFIPVKVGVAIYTQSGQEIELDLSRMAQQPDDGILLEQEIRETLVLNELKRRICA
ncbi:hypothetical protein [Eikenella corrodens]|uniref:Uncharacterized protein n=1 Tax=Eikenella corrodens TaxID=539 RepID=A0A3S9SLX0_EIKCO|nr:hypothetical protein [Eikenella corrodens]AZR60546.1 hypothetical protein ELB75_11345 [Eikenella corrodens]